MGIDYAKPQEFVFDLIASTPTGAEDGSLTLRESLILAYIAYRANRYGTCYPGRDTIARDTRSGPSTVTRALGKFERMGIIRRETKMKSGGGNFMVTRLKEAARAAVKKHTSGS